MQRDRTVNWEYRNTPVTEVSHMPEKVCGFIYHIAFSDGSMYVGKKHIWEYRIVAPAKSGQPRKGHVRYLKKKSGKHMVTREKICRESDWRTYQGSSELVKDKIAVRKQILEYASNDRLLTYLEARWLFKLDVLRNPKYLNDNIDGRYYRSNINGRQDERSNQES